MKNSGFTLVEVLVVSALIAILAAVAIPVYTGYIKTQKQEVVKYLSQTAAASANAYYRRTNTLPAFSDLKLFIPNPSQFTITIDSINKSKVVKNAADNSITATTNF